MDGPDDRAGDRMTIAYAFAFGTHMLMLLVWGILLVLGANAGAWLLSGYLGLGLGLVVSQAVYTVVGHRWVTNRLPVLAREFSGTRTAAWLAIGVGLVAQLVGWFWLGLQWDPPTF